MRTEDFIRKENEDNKTYFTRVAKLIRELKAAGKEKEAAEAYTVVYWELCPIIKEVIECESRAYRLDDATTYEYLKRADDVISRTFDRYNDPEHLTEKDKQFGIKSFIKVTTKYCMRDALARTLCIGLDQCKPLLKIRRAREKLCKMYRIDRESVTVEMIFDELEGAVTKDKIIELSKVEKGFVSLDQTRENGEQVDVYEDNYDHIFGNELSENGKTELDKASARMSDLDVYILFKEFGLLGESLRRMEMCDFVITPTFQKLFEEDKMIRSKDDPVKTAYNKKAKIVRILAELNGKVSMSDVQGCLVSYFMERWNQMEK